MTRTAMLVLAKAPEPGRVKTRLSPAVTPEQAAEIAAASLLDTLDAVGEMPDTITFVAWAGELARAARSADMTKALAPATMIAQSGHGLAARLAAAHAAVADTGHAPVLQIGMDTPQIDVDLLAACASPLHRPCGPDAVLGPADDGGWWALGLRDPHHARVLRSVPMSHEDTGTLTLQALHSAGLRVETLPQLCDVDTIDDAVQVAEQVPWSRFAAAVATLANDPT